MGSRNKGFWKKIQRGNKKKQKLLEISEAL